MHVRTASVLLAAVLAAGFAGCRRETPPPAAPVRTVETTTVVDPPVDLEGQKVETVIPLRHPLAERCEAGSKLDAQRAVAEKKSEFARGETLYFTMWLNESPVGLQATLVITGPAGEEVARIPRTVDGAKHVTFGFDRPLDPGSYRLEGYWGGNVACEETITIGGN